MTDVHKHHILGNNLADFMTSNDMEEDGKVKQMFLPDPSYLWWVDIETTGLVPEDGRILEVAFMVTTPALERIGLLHGYVGPAPDDEEVAHWPEVVRKMHTDNKLIDDMRASQLNDDIVAADKYFFDFLNAHVPESSTQLTLAGSSVHFDKHWLDRHMPMTAGLFNYRLADISAVRVFMDRWAPFFPEMVDALKPMKQHRVIPDIEDSLVLARFIRMLVRSGVADLMPQGYAIFLEGASD